MKTAAPEPRVGALVWGKKQQSSSKHDASAPCTTGTHLPLSRAGIKGTRAAAERRGMQLVFALLLPSHTFGDVGYLCELKKVSVPSKPAPAQAPSPSPSQAKAASSPRSAGGETAGGLPARFITRLTSGLTEAPNQRQKENGGHQKSRNKQC